MVEARTVSKRMRTAGYCLLAAYVGLGILTAKKIQEFGERRQNTEPKYSLMNKLVTEEKRAKLFLDNYTFEDFKREPQWLDVRREDYKTAKSNLKSYISTNPETVNEYNREVLVNSDKIGPAGKTVFSVLGYGGLGLVGLGALGGYLFRREDKD